MGLDSAKTDAHSRTNPNRQHAPFTAHRPFTQVRRALPLALVRPLAGAARTTLARPHLNLCRKARRGLE